MDQMHLRKALMSQLTALLQILDQRGVVFPLPYTDQELAKLSIPDLKALVSLARDLARTPTGN